MPPWPAYLNSTFISESVKPFVCRVRKDTVQTNMLLSVLQNLSLLSWTHRDADFTVISGAFSKVTYNWLDLQLHSTPHLNSGLPPTRPREIKSAPVLIPFCPLYMIIPGGPIEKRVRASSAHRRHHSVKTLRSDWFMGGWFPWLSSRSNMLGYQQAGLRSSKLG